MGNFLFENEKKKYVLIAGESKSGKTTFLYKIINYFKKDLITSVDTSSTYGFNHEIIKENNIELNLIDFGGDLSLNSIGYYFYKNIKVDFWIYIIDFQDFLKGNYSKWFINLNSIINDFEMYSTQIYIIINCHKTYYNKIQDMNKTIDLKQSEISYKNNSKANNSSFVKLNNKFFKENKKLGNLILYDTKIFGDQLIKELFQKNFGNFKYTIINKEIEILFFNIVEPNNYKVFKEFINQFFV